MFTLKKFQILVLICFFLSNYLILNRNGNEAHAGIHTKTSNINYSNLVQEIAAMTQSLPSIQKLTLPTQVDCEALSKPRLVVPLKVSISSSSKSSSSFSSPQNFISPLDQLSTDFVETQYKNYLKNNSTQFYKNKNEVRQITIPQTKQDRSTTIKYISTKDYNNPSTKDFIRRLSIVVEAAAEHLKENRYPDVNHSLDAIRSKYTQILKSEAHLDRKAFEQAFLSNDTRPVEAVIKKANAILKRFVGELCIEIGKITHKPLTKKNLRNIENEYVFKTGRNNIINFYEVLPSKEVLRSKNNSIGSPLAALFASTQRPFTRKGPVLPSTIRDRAGLPNAVEATLHRIDFNGKAIPLFAGYRHSSTPPIKISDPSQRRAIAAQNVLQMIKKIIGNHLESKKECPSEVNLSSLLLLTPFKFDTLRGSESESRQIDESYIASRTFDGKIVSIFGCRVKVHTNMMNVPSNKMDQIVSSLGISTDLSARINARGFDIYENQVLKFIQDKIDLFEKNKSKLSPALQSKLIYILRGLKQLKTFHQTKNEQADKIRSKISILELDLKEEYENLQQVQEILVQPWVKNSPLASKKLKNQESSLYKKIMAEEKNLHSEFIKLQKIKEKHYFENEKTVHSFETLLKQAGREFIQTLDANQKTQLNPSIAQKTSSELERVLDVVHLLSEAREIYFHKLFKKWDQKLDLQRVYALSNYLIGNLIEILCKSGKDRTGFLFNQIEYEAVYKSLYGEYPDRNSPENRALMKLIAERVNHGGTSRDAAGLNIPGAPGLLISPDIFYGSLARIEYKMGKLARGIY